MTILFTALALAGAPAAAAIQPGAASTHAQHAQHAQDAKHGQHAMQRQPATAASGDTCPCCKQMAKAGKMACCAMHGQGADHSGHKGKH